MDTANNSLKAKFLLIVSQDHFKNGCPKMKIYFSGSVIATILLVTMIWMGVTKFSGTNILLDYTVMP